MYDVNYVLDAIQGWRNEHTDDPTKGLDELMGIIKREDVYGRDLAQMENVEFLKNFRKYTETQSDADKFKRVGEAAAQDLANRYSERVAVIIAKQKFMADRRITGDQVDILLHSLGHPMYYRNYFAADEGSRDWDDIQTLVKAGMVEPYQSRDHDSGLQYYRVTEHGKQCLRDAGFALPKGE